MSQRIAETDEEATPMDRSEAPLLMLATFGREIVECGGAIAQHVRAGGAA